MTKIKICGLKRIEDIEAVNTLYPDYIGFVFADFSHRYVDKQKAGELKSKLDPRIKAVGVFVNEDVNFVAELLNEGIIDIAQLHGSEDEDYIRELRSRSDAEIIRAFNTNKVADISEIENSSADMVLVDSGTGSGETFDWSKLKEIKRPYLLAGGLGPDNIAHAVESIHPYGVDVSSGVETDRHKDSDKMKRFVNIVRSEDARRVHILKAERSDLEEVLKLQYLAYRSEAALFNRYDIQPLTETMEELITQFERGTILKMLDEDKIIGSVRAYEENESVYIGKLMVDPVYQRRGYGKRLISEIEKCYPGRRYELFTSYKSVKNIALYESVGYKLIDKTEVYDGIKFVYLEKQADQLK